MKRILFNGIASRRGGSLTYIRNVVGAFPRRDDLRLTVLLPFPIEGLPDRPDIEFVQAPRWVRKPIPRLMFGQVFFRFLWNRRRDFDAVYHAGGSMDVALPGRPLRIVAFRNMLPFDLEARRRFRPGWNRLRNWLLRWVQARDFRRADLVIFISDYAREVIDAAVPHRRGRSVVVPHGVARETTPLDPAVAARLPERFVLYVSMLDAYKAQVELIEAWAMLREARPTGEKLVLAGPEYKRYARRVRAAIRRLGLEEEVILLGIVRHDQVLDLMRRAALNLFLSSCENCPNILLELLEARTPLLVSARPPMPELGGPGLCYVEPYDVPAVARAVARLLDDPALGARVAAAAGTEGRRFSWERAGAMTWTAIIETLIGAEEGAGDAPASPKTETP